MNKQVIVASMGVSSYLGLQVETVLTRAFGLKKSVANEILCNYLFKEHGEPTPMTEKEYKKFKSDLKNNSGEFKGAVIIKTKGQEWAKKNAIKDIAKVRKEEDKKALLKLLR